MNELIKKDSLKILDRVIQILKSKEDKDTIEIKNLSNHTIHNASVFQDQCSISIAVIIYALSKIIERKKFELNLSKMIRNLEKARKFLNNDDMYGFSLALKKLFSEISKIDSGLKLYAQHVINEAQVKKGCKLCEHGLSTEKASQVIGVSQWDLMNYLGNTKFKENIAGVDVKSRLKFARGLFS